MTEVEIDPKKSVYENAADYYEKSKKAKHKIEGLRVALARTRAELEKEKARASVELAAPAKKVVRSAEPYEKFHWFFAGTSLVLAGKDAKSNQTLVKKYLEDNDLYFHADVHGAPSVILKNGQSATEKQKDEAAQFAACYSSAWKAERTVCDVFAVLPDQVRTAAKSGEYLPKGGFVIAGKKEWFRNKELRLAVTFLDNKLQVLPEGALPTNVKRIVIKPSDESKNVSAKMVLKRLLEMFPECGVDLDWIMQRLPNGGSRIIQ